MNLSVLIGIGKINEDNRYIITEHDINITLNQEEKYGVISATKKQILENKYDEIAQTYLGQYYLIKQEGKQKLINSKACQSMLLYY